MRNIGFERLRNLGTDVGRLKNAVAVILRRRWPWLLIPVGAGLVVGLGALAVMLPPRLVEGGLSSSDRAKEIGDLRTALIGIVAGVAVAGGTVIGALNFVNSRAALEETQRQNRISEEQSREQLKIQQRGQVTERFTKAIDQLGEAAEGKLAVRLGGIYALEQIARDSGELYWPVMEVLCTYMRENAKPTEDVTIPPPAADPGGLLPGVPECPADIQAIAAVLSRRPEEHRDAEPAPLDLSGVNLRKVFLPDAKLDKVYLAHAHLQRAKLMRASLRETMFSHSHLEYVEFTGADLRRAFLYWAHLYGAFLHECDLRGARLLDADLTTASIQNANLEDADLSQSRLGGADLSGSSLRRARLVGADLRGARFERADLTGTILWGANLVDTLGLTRGQLDLADVDNLTQLPAHLR